MKSTYYSVYELEAIDILNKISCSEFTPNNKRKRNDNDDTDDDEYEKIINILKSIHQKNAVYFYPCYDPKNEVYYNYYFLDPLYFNNTSSDYESFYNDWNEYIQSYNLNQNTYPNLGQSFSYNNWDQYSVPYPICNHCWFSCNNWIQNGYVYDDWSKYISSDKTFYSLSFKKEYIYEENEIIQNHYPFSNK